MMQKLESTIGVAITPGALLAVTARSKKDNDAADTAARAVTLADITLGRHIDAGKRGINGSDARAREFTVK